LSEFASLQEYYTAVRSEGFSNEVKKRLLLGNYVVTHENYEKYYKKGYEARKYLQAEFSRFFQTYHVVATPTSPSPAMKIGEKANSASMYLEDLYTVTANLGELPAISLPMGMVKEGKEALPVGIQLMGPKWKEGVLLDIAEGIEQK
jgi:aspartyl-tRNA(Asn)/glutamyl-tRNA(Gln) amidotransferase subunit A